MKPVGRCKSVGWRFVSADEVADRKKVVNLWLVVASALRVRRSVGAFLVITK